MIIFYCFLSHFIDHFYNILGHHNPWSFLLFLRHFIDHFYNTLGHHNTWSFLLFLRHFIDHFYNIFRSSKSRPWLSPLSLATDVTDATLGTSGLWLGARTGADGTATLTKSFLVRSPWLHGQQFYLKTPLETAYNVFSMHVWKWMSGVWNCKSSTCRSGLQCKSPCFSLHVGSAHTVVLFITEQTST